MSAMYFTSDTHFSHKKILQYESRPFTSVDEMDEALINIWNATIQPLDEVFHLGDFSLGSVEQTISILRRLNGKIHLIQGNHDLNKKWDIIRKENLIESFHPVGIELTYNKHRMWLTHYPLGIGLRPRKWSISGHIHSMDNQEFNQINVGVDAKLWKHKPFGQPISMMELWEVMEGRTPEIEELFQSRKQSH
ncbi:metallophosphoesterase family protein (plasmid) [Lysinibacillus capsici]|uniref:metallophosphoesterase family protein n=1 Tax=Lysinibacillus capsici TaxID=2115968 RepID=UPI0021D9D2F5|nr:metallophosphoesterase family protein [Lysinibacillus capsici]UYB50110.1 metallophosphoesterase family protein [Lysinibacillus capsici]